MVLASDGELVYSASKVLCQIICFVIGYVLGTTGKTSYLVPKSSHLERVSHLL